MQISKVDNNRIGVKPGEETGIMYRSPGSMQDINNIVERRIKAARALYSPVVNLNDKGKNKKSEDRELKIVHKVLNSYFGNFKNRKLWGRLSAENIRENIKAEGTKIVSEEVISIKVEKCLRKTLARDPEVCRAITKICLLCMGRDTYLTDEECSLAADAINKDYLCEGKGKGRESISKSIRNQNLVIQPQKCEDGMILNISGQGEKRSEIKKEMWKALQNFLRMYACIDDSSRKEIRMKLRRLLVLYIYGEAEVSVGEFDEWREHKKRRQEETDYIIEEINEELDKELRKKNIECYRNALACVKRDEQGIYFEDNSINEFWIRHFQAAFEKICKKASCKKQYMLQKGYISEKIWKDAIETIAIKYIAIGKELWYFTMDDLDKESGVREPGKISEHLQDGISSFDFETIKAKETLQRETAVYVLFAVNNYARETMEMTGDDDFLLMKIDEIQAKAKKNILKNTLKFFGGISEWEKTEAEFIREYSAGDKGCELINDFRRMLYSLRNESFHFAAKREDSLGDQTAVPTMLAHDLQDVSNVIRKQYYSNNLPKFYQKQDIGDLMTELYRDNVNRQSQVPSFKKVFVRNKFAGFISEKLKLKTPAAYQPEDVEQWRSGIYFICKEIYYNHFIFSERAREYFLREINSPSFNQCEQKNDRALKDFRNAVKAVDNGSLEEICIYIMTEQNRRNQGTQKTADSGKSMQRKFKHYSLLLEEGLRCAFVKYLGFEQKTSKYAFIAGPVEEPKKMPEMDEFLPNWKSAAYEQMAKSLSGDTDVQKWYILGRLLPPRQLNHLKGSLRDYLQYVGDIRRRAEIAEIKPDGLLIDVETKKYNKICLVLDMCSRLSGSFSKEISDYFENKEEYKKFVGQYVEENALHDSRFFDEINPIPNRNIIMAKLYGCHEVLSKAAGKITEEDLRALSRAEEGIRFFKQNGKCVDIEEQKKLIRFQQLKNKVELAVVCNYAEIVNELLGRLINWSFMRERDLMYFQLGFHYMCLKNGSEKPAGYQTIEGKNGIKTNNVILWQIAAMYVNGISMYVHVDRDGKVTKTDSNAGTSAGQKIGMFCRYTEKIGLPDKECLYNAGLELFENLNEHAGIITTRNYIDHFKYYGGIRSILDLYSEVFDRFFTYNNGLRKNVTVVLCNILQRHFVAARLSFGDGTKKVNENDKAMSQIGFCKNGLSSDYFTYHFADSSKRLPAVSADFIRALAKILYYPHEAPESIVNTEQIQKIWNDPEEEKIKDHKCNWKSGNEKGKYKKKRDQGESIGDGVFAAAIGKSGWKNGNE